MKVLPRVFRLSGVPDSVVGRLWATSLWMGDDGFFNGTTAAFILGLDGIESPDRICVTRSSGVTGPPWLKIIRLGERNPPPRRWVNGFRISQVERVVVECAEVLPVRRMGRALDDALRRRLTTPQRLRSFIAGPGRGRRGVRLLRELFEGRDDRDAQVRSRFETKMLAILRRIENHRFLADFEVDVEDEKYFIDFYLPQARLGIECHSFRWHIGQHNSDARRDRHIRSRSIEILYFTWDDVTFRPKEVERDIRAAILRRTATLLD